MFGGVTLKSGGVNAVLMAQEKSSDDPVLDFIVRNPASRANQISAALNIPLRTLQRELSRLKASGKIAFRGAPKNGGYFGK